MEILDGWAAAWLGSRRTTFGFLELREALLVEAGGYLRLMTWARRWVFALALLLVVALVTACGDSGGENDAPPVSTSATTTDGDIAIPAQPAGGGESISAILSRELESRAEREQKVLRDATLLGPELNDFWTRELQGVYRMAFDPPDRFEWYRGVENAACGGRDEPLPNNAYYCSAEADEFVAFDLEWFQGYLVDHPGGATTFLILAHEWGHAVQDTWREQGGTDVWQPAYRQELNADCLAGRFLAASIANGTILVEDGDEDAIFDWLYDAGSSPWLEPGDHGTQLQRQVAFDDGFRNSTDLCRQRY